MDEPLLQFSAISGLTFALIGLALILLITIHIYTLVVIARLTKNTLRIIKRQQEADKARQEIKERDRVRILRMIRRKATDEEWAELLAQLGERDRRLTEEE